MCDLTVEVQDLDRDECILDSLNAARQLDLDEICDSMREFDISEAPSRAGDAHEAESFAAKRLVEAHLEDARGVDIGDERREIVSNLEARTGEYTREGCRVDDELLRTGRRDRKNRVVCRVVSAQNEALFDLVEVRLCKGQLHVNDPLAYI